MPVARLEQFPDNPYNAYCWVIGEPDVGTGCWVGAFVTLDGSGGLTIGQGCDVSNGVQIMTHSSARRTVTARAFADVERRPVHIGDHVFIGVNASILMGARVGSHSIIAAGAVVIQDAHFPPYSLIAGVPAKRIGDVRWTPENP
jgi:acetyltransferase-like isoleucine patch superfamily enzyme